MNCPECGRETRVDQSETDGSLRIRRRHCTECGCQFYTGETQIEDKAKGKIMLNAFHQRRIHERSGKKTGCD